MMALVVQLSDKHNNILHSWQSFADDSPSIQFNSVEMISLSSIFSHFNNNNNKHGDCNDVNGWRTMPEHNEIKVTWKIHREICKKHFHPFSHPSMIFGFRYILFFAAAAAARECCRFGPFSFFMQDRVSERME